jgi:hypothetical protein
VWFETLKFSCNAYSAKDQGQDSDFLFIGSIEPCAVIAGPLVSREEKKTTTTNGHVKQFLTADDKMSFAYETTTTCQCGNCLETDHDQTHSIISIEHPVLIETKHNVHTIKFGLLGKF